MGRYFLKFSYIGSSYRGSQKQISNTVNDIDSIQGAIESALLTITPKPIERPKIYISSRTDAGVHALCATAHTNLENKYNALYDSDTICRSLNRYFSNCRHTIRLLDWIPVTNDFESRHTIKSRTYMYRFMRAKTYDDKKIPILEIQHSYHLRAENFDIERIKSATQLFLGKKDFRTFAAKLEKHRTYIREIQNITVEEGRPLMPFDALASNFNYWHINITSKSFLYNQVRRIVGVLIALGLGRITERDIKIMLQVPGYNNLHPQVYVVPACGLHLVKVEYPLDYLETCTIR